jgi:phosphatidylserine decarboxylase
MPPRLQYLLPHHLISGIVRGLTRLSLPPLHTAAIRWFIGAYGVDMHDAEERDAAGYRSFNAFFTRALKPGARPLAGGTETLVCPVDGTVSQAGRISGGRIFQAKGLDYSAAELLGSGDEAARYQEGSFATLYLAPYNYHRIHMPADGRLRAMQHVPGRLFSVSAPTVAAIPRLFARNERVVCHFSTPHGRMALVLVGALNVGCMETVWHGVVAPPPRGQPDAAWFHYPEDGSGAVTLARGAEMGRFNMGSTVILLFENPALQFAAGILPGEPVRLGQALAFAG